MADSTLTLAMADLRTLVLSHLGWNPTYASLTAAQQTRLGHIIDEGLRRFYFHEPVPFAPEHEWSFLSPIDDLQTAAAYSTGTVAITINTTTVTLTSGTWPTWAASGVFVIGGVSYPVETRTSGSVIVLSRAYTGSTVTAATYEINQQDYDLPDDFGGLRGPVTFAMNESMWKLKEVHEAQIRLFRQHGHNTGIPTHCAVREKTSTLAASQKWEIMFWPTPDAVYNLEMPYTILANQLTTAAPHVYGGMAMSQAVVDQCLAVADARLDAVAGINAQQAMKSLTAAIKHDLHKAPRTLGYNGDKSTRIPRRQERLGDVTVAGVLYT